MYIQPRSGEKLLKLIFGLIQLIGSTSDPIDDLNLIQIDPNQSLVRLVKTNEQSGGIIDIEGHAFEDLLMFDSLEKKKNKQKSGLHSTICVWVVLYTFLLVAPSSM